MPYVTGGVGADESAPGSNYIGGGGGPQTKFGSVANRIAQITKTQSTISGSKAADSH